MLSFKQNKIISSTSYWPRKAKLALLTFKAVSHPSKSRSRTRH